MIGELKNRITINRYRDIQTITGGSQAVLVDTWSKWAKVENRTGSVSTNAGQSEWSYDYEITARYEPTRPVKSNDLLVYKSGGSYTKMLIRSLSFEKEGRLTYEIMRASFIEQQTEEEYNECNNGEMTLWYVADGTEGDSLFMDGNGGRPNLIGKKLIEVNRENYELRPTGEPLRVDDIGLTPKKFEYNPELRLLRFVGDLQSGEQVKLTVTNQ